MNRRNHAREVAPLRPQIATTARQGSEDAGPVELKDIIRMQCAILRENEAHRLIDTLLMFAVEIARPERALFFTMRGQDLAVEAEAAMRDGGVQILKSSAPTRLPAILRSVLRYVARTQENVVLDNASAENQFAQPNRPEERDIRSLICLPLTARRNLIGALYLENASPAAFAPGKLASLELLSAQAASSLCAALLVQDLKRQTSQRTATEEELERLQGLYRQAHLSSRAALMGGLTAALAHELNQPLGAIRSNAQAIRRLLDARKPDLAEARIALEDIIQDNSRAVEIVQNVRSIFRREATELAPVNLLELVRDVAHMVRADAAERGIAVDLDLPVSLPDVMANKAHLIQVLRNLIVNAFEAICEREDPHATRELVISAVQDEPGYARVAIRDSGKGIAPEMMSRLFEPFFTTKPNGMGMGLAIVQSIIENHRGRLWATRNPEHGATLQFKLPLSGVQSARH